MRLNFLTLVLAAFIFSCNNSNTDKQHGADSARDASTDESRNPGPRTITDAIDELKTTLESKDRNSIAGLFEFPMPDTVMAVYLDDSTFRKSYRAAGDKLTKSLFMTYYDTIARYTNLSDIIEGFTYLPVDSLRYTNKISKGFKEKNEPCTRSYSIEVEGEEVKITYSTNHNDTYVVPKGSADDDLHTSGCEYTASWFFRFDGNKLRFVRHVAAG